MSQILKLLPQVFGKPVDCLQFQNWRLLFNSATEIYSKNKAIIFLLDIPDSGYNSISYLNKLNDLVPDSIKIICSEKKNLLDILKRIKNKSNVQYLAKPVDLTDLTLAFEMAGQTDEKLRLAQSRTIRYEKLLAKIEKTGTIKINSTEEKERARDKIFSIIAHDLRSPFTALLGLSEILINNWDSLQEKDKLEISEDIRNTSKETYQLLQDLLQWTKSHNGKIYLSPEKTQIKDVINQVIALEKENAQVKDISIVNKIPEDICLWVDKQMISTVFRNLISNAVKFIPERGKIVLSAFKENSFYTFCIEDNGNGINKPFITKLFKKNNSMIIPGKEYRINGLGLILCKEFVERNRGNIWLESAKGKGSKFYFTVPAASELKITSKKSFPIPA